MKRSNQVIIESAIFAGLILGISVAGTISTQSLPYYWLNLNNPSNTSQAQYNLGDLALFYNTTLDELASQQFNAVSESLAQSAFLNYPSTLSTAVGSANSEIAAANASIPIAVSDVGLAQQLIAKGELGNASSMINLGCGQVQSAVIAFTQFQNSTTPEFSSLGVPVSLYSVSAARVNSLIQSLQDQCDHSLPSEIGALSSSSSSSSQAKANVTFTITSTQSSFQTGGYLSVQGELLFNNTALVDDNVSFYLNGANFANVKTNADGSFSVNASTPFIYQQLASLWAVASADRQAAGFYGAVSNTLYFQVIFNQTQIDIADPPAVLPTFNFTVSGSLGTIGGRPLPNAPVTVTSFGTDYFVTTNSTGAFTKTLTVPSSAADGIHYIYAAFAPLGVYGPSVNFTSIQVIHEALNIRIKNPLAQAYSGFSEPISGTVMANGTAISRANVTINTPWGQVFAKTDDAGRFNASMPIPIWEFGSTSGIRVSAAPSQSYIASGSSYSIIKILNPLEIALPILVLGVLVYELQNLGILSSLLKRVRRSGKRGGGDTAETGTTTEAAMAMMMTTDQTARDFLSRNDLNASDKQSEEIVEIYNRALELAKRNFGLTVLSSSTVREIMAQVDSAASAKGGRKGFATISLILEDFLYSKTYDMSRANSAAVALRGLEKIWDATSTSADDSKGRDSGSGRSSNDRNGDGGGRGTS